MTGPEFAEEVLDDLDLLRARDPRDLLPAVAGAGAQVRETARLTEEAGLGRITDGGRPRGLVIVARREGAVAASVSRMVSSRSRRPASSARSRKKSSAPSLGARGPRRTAQAATRWSGSRNPATGSPARVAIWSATRSAAAPASGPSAAITGSAPSSSSARVLAGFTNDSCAGPHSPATSSSAAAIASGSATPAGISSSSVASRSSGVSRDHSVVCCTRDLGRAT